MYMYVFKNLIYDVPEILFSSKPKSAIQKQQYDVIFLLLLSVIQTHLVIWFENWFCDRHAGTLLSFLLVIQVTYSLKFILFKLLSAKEVVKMMLDHMTNPQTSTHLDLKKGKNAISLLSLTKIQILLNTKLHGFNVNSMLI